MDQQPEGPLASAPAGGRPSYKMEVIRLLKQRGVSLRDIADIVYEIQSGYVPGLTREHCLTGVDSVIEKREVQHALMTGIILDRLAENHDLPEPLQDILERDDALYGVDEVLALAVTNVYGSIGMTNFGYLDKQKTGILATLHGRGKTGEVHTFLDDLIASVAAAAAAKIAHHSAG